ncbi:signal peptide peptidase SppA [Halobaculum magnesiiphilum]|uniref:Signal peptide peptidase SppA n=1 Tax=Halobaculum magnesiiphilum TaxID=1017351 RepID=A0A8T8WBT9_9EURY|nr:signal peptide peptidase SppA [Halobaculum magnesiiphilum]QZP37310.1 signal peptide peptidase SppA [Halobaculum magnesiiphilum]
MANTTGRSVLGVAVLVAAAVIAALVGYVLFVVVPGDLAELIGVVLTIAVVAVALKVAGGTLASRFADYTVAEVAVEGPITRDGGGGGLPSSPTTPGADEVVDQIERADDDPNAEALLVKLNTPGGQIVPSEDIRLAAERFDGPTVGYATDTCASGGYAIAVGCDELWAREGSVVGSIGVIGSRPNVHELADRLGVSYEQFTAGEYKDAGLPLKEVTPDERAYLQGIVDDYYDQFVEQVAEGRDMDEEAVRETEARVFLGTEAHERGLVDGLGDREAVLDRIEELTGHEAVVEEFTPSSGLMGRLRGGAAATAYALGAGVADAVAGDGSTGGNGAGDMRFRR